MAVNRIFFKGNPYPLGHVIIDFGWSGHLDEDGQLWFDLHLKTDDYYAEDPAYFDEATEEYNDEDNDEEDNDWKAKNAWANYHACTMSSTEWGSNGILVDKKLGKLNFANWQPKRLVIDTMPPDNVMPAEMEWDDLALHIYLLGHDACANHQIEIVQVGRNLFNFNWAGKIALAYKGEDEFKYSFSANMANVKFAGFDYPQTSSQAQAREQFATYIDDLDSFEFVDLNPKSNRREYKFALK